MRPAFNTIELPNLTVLEISELEILATKRISNLYPFRRKEGKNHLYYN